MVLSLASTVDNMASFAVPNISIFRLEVLKAIIARCADAKNSPTAGLLRPDHRLRGMFALTAYQAEQP
jgi:hypothetical protein